MTLRNETSCILEILSENLEPNATLEISEKIFNNLEIHSSIGSSVITTEHGRRIIRNKGKLFAKESKIKDKDNMKIIVLSFAN